jgi:hypothetical protein
LPAVADRTCLHCALARALRAEMPAFAARGMAVTFTRSEPVWLPASGAGIYRGVRRILRLARAHADRSPVKLAVVDLRGKSEVEVTATALSAERAQVFRCAFPRHAPGTLAGGFAEAAE